MFLAGLFVFGVVCYAALGLLFRRKIDRREKDNDR